ncbi:hypothetical protein DV737_g298, partial [Chaetothyriales sp. CBS 132003]
MLSGRYDLTETVNESDLTALIALTVESALIVETALTEESAWTMLRMPELECLVEILEQIPLSEERIEKDRPSPRIEMPAAFCVTPQPMNSLIYLPGLSHEPVEMITRMTWRWTMMSFQGEEYPNGSLNTMIVPLVAQGRMTTMTTVADP